MQSTVAGVNEGVKITNSSDAVVTEISEQSVQKISSTTAVVDEPMAEVVKPRVLAPEISEEPASAQIALGGMGDAVAAMHGDVSSGLSVDGRDTSRGTGFHAHAEKHESGMRTLT